MSFEQILTGAVIRYPYLLGARGRRRRDGGAQGQASRRGRQNRSAGRRFDPPLSHHHEPPAAGRFSAELPLIEKKRAGLDPTLRLWLTLDEFNTDVVGRSFYLEPSSPIGRLSKAFFLPLLREFVARRDAFAQINRLRQSVIPKSGCWFSDEITLKTKT